MKENSLKQLILFKLCSIHKIAAQEESLKSELPFIRMLFSIWMLDEDCTLLFIEQLEKVNIKNFIFYSIKNLNI